MRATTLIDPAHLLQLEAAISRAEEDSEGEIVLVVADRCDGYSGARWRFAVALAALVFLALILFAPPLPTWVYLVAQALTLIVGHVASRIENVLRLLLPGETAEARVRARAQRAFAEHGLHRTRNQTGVLLFAALLERHFVVLADTRVNDVLREEESWDEVVALATAGFRERRVCEGLEVAIERCGVFLKRTLPAGTDNPDELPNTVRLAHHAAVVLDSPPKG